MRMNVVVKHMKLTDDLKAMLEKKLHKLDRYFSDDTVAQVKLAREHERRIVEITIPYEGGFIRAEVEGMQNDTLSAIEEAERKLDRQIRRHRTALEKRLKVNAFTLPMEPEDEAVEEEEAGRVVRTKRFSMKPQDVEEAMLQMDLLGHSFYVFHNAQTDEVNVLYRRNDGDYGLIEPDVE